MAKARTVVLPEGALTSGVVELPDAVARHVRDVLRLRSGALVRVTDGAGCVANAAVVRVERRRVEIEVAEDIRTQVQTGPTITLLQGVGKGDKLDTVVRQTVELGVTRLQPVLSERAIGHKEVKQERLQTIAEDALRVSGRAWRPEILQPKSLPAVLSQPRAERPIALALGATTAFVECLVGRPASVELLIGPEGGLSAAEVEAAEVAGFRSAHLGPYTLRTETAGPAVVAATMALCGAWDAGSV